MTATRHFPLLLLNIKLNFKHRFTSAVEKGYSFMAATIILSSLDKQFQVLHLLVEIWSRLMHLTLNSCETRGQ